MCYWCCKYNESSWNYECKWCDKNSYCCANLVCKHTRTPFRCCLSIRCCGDAEECFNEIFAMCCCYCCQYYPTIVCHDTDKSMSNKNMTDDCVYNIESQKIVHQYNTDENNYK